MVEKNNIQPVPPNVQEDDSIQTPESGPILRQPPSAEENLVPDMFKESQPTELPTTADSIQETEAAAKRQERLQKEKEKQRRLTGREPSDAEALRSLIRQEKDSEAKKIQKASSEISAKREASKVRLDQVSSQLMELKQDIDYAQKSGLDYDLSSLKESEANLAAEQERLKSELEPVTPATPEDVQKAAQPTVTDIQEIAEPLRQQNAVVQVANANAIEKVKHVEQVKAKAEAAIKEEDSRIQVANFADFWKNQSAGGKVFAAIGMAIGAVGQALTGSQKNSFISAVNDGINQSIKVQNLNARQSLAEREHKLRMVDQRIRAMGAATDDQIKKMKLQQMQQEVITQADLTRQRREFAQMLESGEPIPLHLLPPETRKEANSLRIEYNNETARLNTNRLISQYKVIKKAYTAPAGEEGPADLSLIFSYMKVLDPTAVVRPSEFANAENAGNIPDKIRGIYNKVMTGGRLSPAQRRAFFAQAGKIMESKMEEQSRVNKRYSDVAMAAGIPPQLIVEKFDTVFTPRDRLISQQLQLPKNKDLTREAIEANIDKLIASGKLPESEYGK